MKNHKSADCSWPHFRSLSFVNGDSEREDARVTTIHQDTQFSDCDQEAEVQSPAGEMDKPVSKSIEQLEKELASLKEHQKASACYSKNDEEARKREFRSFFETLIPHVVHIDAAETMLYRNEIQNVTYQFAYPAHHKRRALLQVQSPRKRPTEDDGQ